MILENLNKFRGELRSVEIAEDVAQLCGMLGHIKDVDKDAQSSMEWNLNQMQETQEDMKKRLDDIQESLAQDIKEMRRKIPLAVQKADK